MFSSSADLITTNKQEHFEIGTITIDDKSFTNYGSVLQDKNGLLCGIFYAYPKENKIGSWDGSFKHPANYMQEWRSAFIDYHGSNQVNQLIKFTIGNKLFRGMWYNKNWSDIVRVKEIRS